MQQNFKDSLAQKEELRLFISKRVLARLEHSVATCWKAEKFQQIPPGNRWIQYVKSFHKLLYCAPVSVHITP